MVNLLTRLGWSQTFFADHCEISRDTVSDWCKGKTEGPGYKLATKYLQTMCRIIGV